MNPYEPSQVTELAPSRNPIPEFIPKLQPGIGRIILREWFARLWIYNGVLAIVFMSFWATDYFSWEDFDSGVPFVYLNAGFLLCPLLEWVITKKRQRRVDWGPAMFAGGLVIGFLALLIFIAFAKYRGFRM